MRHAEILRGQPGVIPSDCAGELVRHGVYKDKHLGPDRAYVERTVTVWECAACSALVSTSEGFILNAYHPMVCALAEALDARPLLPAEGPDPGKDD